MLVPSRVSASVPRDGPLSHDATLASLALVVDGEAVDLTPAFDPETTLYSATDTGELVRVEAEPTKSEARVASYTVDGDETVMDEGEDKEAPRFLLKEGAITAFSLEVKAEDGATTRNYHVGFARPSRQMLPEISIEASRDEYVAGLGSLVFTLTRTGDTSSALGVTFNVTQEEVWLSTTSYDATFTAGESEATVHLLEEHFSKAVTRSGNLVAAVGAVAGYDTSGTSAQVRVISQEGPAIEVSLEHTAYSFSESAGEVAVLLVARAVPGLPYVSSFQISFSSAAREAVSGLGGDYKPISELVSFEPSDFEEEGGSLVGRKEALVTIFEDDIHEEDEEFELHPSRSLALSFEIVPVGANGDICVGYCTDPYVVTIVDDDDLDLIVGMDQIEENGATSSTVTISMADGSTFSGNTNITVHFRGAASFGDDYTVSPADSDTADGYQVTATAGATSVELTVTAVDDTISDPCEWVHVSTKSGQGAGYFTGNRTIVIADNDLGAADDITPIAVGLDGELSGGLTESDAGADRYSFEATAGESYIIEVKHPMMFTAIGETGVGGDPIQVPGYLVDPSILEITDDQGTQVIGEQGQGGFTLNFARAFFTPEDDGTHYIAVGAGHQDRTAYGCYTISVRVDDHADDFKTDPTVILHPGESLSAYIDSDVATDDPGLNPWDWKITPPLRQGGESDDVVRPRRGIESLDDRDLFRYEIADAGMYEVSVSGQPTGVGIWYIWDRQGNLYAESTTGPAETATLPHESGTYYVEVGTPYESEGNTGAYTISVNAAN